MLRRKTSDPFLSTFSDHHMIHKFFVSYFQPSDAYQLTHVCKTFHGFFQKSAKDIGPIVDTLFHHVGMGEQDKAETLLKKDSGLLLIKKQFTDPFGRTFKNISVFQYAVWALDQHMWRMILNYLPKDQAQQQLQELEEKGTEHGKHFDFSNLLNALQTDANSSHSYLINTIGHEQRNSVAHVLNQYCHPTRAFNPTPSFEEKTFPRSLISQYPLLPLTPDKGIGIDCFLTRDDRYRTATLHKNSDHPFLKNLLASDYKAIKKLQEKSLKALTQLKCYFKIEKKTGCVVM